MLEERALGQSFERSNANGIQCTLGENYAPACAGIIAFETMQAREKNGPVVKLKMGRNEYPADKTAGRDEGWFVGTVKGGGGQG